MSDVVRVLLAEPDAPTRAGIRLALEAEAFEICAEPLDARAAVEIAVRDRPDVCLISEDLPGGAIIAVDAMYRRLPDTKLVMLTESEEPDSLFAAIRAGASGYVRTDLDPARLTATIRLHELVSDTLVAVDDRDLRALAREHARLRRDLMALRRELAQLRSDCDRLRADWRALSS